MARRDRRSQRRRFGWRRPRWKDPAFWVAVVLAAILIGVQVALVGDLSEPLAWVGLGVRAILTWVFVSALIRIRVGMRRGLVSGFAEAEVRAEQREAPSHAEALARTSGRAVGRAVSAYKRSQSKP